MKFRIRHLSGSKAGQEEILEGQALTVGRDPACNLRFDPHLDDRVSTNHAQILVQDNGQVMLTDLGSSNGTFIGEQQITSSVPIMTGAMVTFGDGGPQVSIIFEPPDAPAPAAPPPKKSKKGLIIVLVIVVLLLAGCCIGGIASGLFSSGEDDTAEGPDDVDGDGDGDGDGAEDGASDGDGAEDGASDGASDGSGDGDGGGEEQEVQTVWAKIGVDSVYELKSLMEMDMGGTPFKSETQIKWTLKARDDEFATVLMESTSSGTTTPIEQKIPLKATGSGEVEEKSTTVKVPAGEFDCTYRKVTTKNAGGESTSETWMNDDDGIIYKSVSKYTGGESLMELVEVKKDEKVKVPAGEFDCLYTKTKMTAAGQETTMEVWTSKELPAGVTYKSVTTAKTSTTTSEMVSMDVK